MKLYIFGINILLVIPFLKAEIHCHISDGTSKKDSLKSYIQHIETVKELAGIGSEHHQTVIHGRQTSPLITNPSACKNWREQDYWNALARDFGQLYPASFHGKLPSDLKCFARNNTYRVYILEPIPKLEKRA